jgi:hypothetical protein
MDQEPRVRLGEMRRGEHLPHLARGVVDEAPPRPSDEILRQGLLIAHEGVEHGGLALASLHAGHVVQPVGVERIRQVHASAEEVALAIEGADLEVGDRACRPGIPDDHGLAERRDVLGIRDPLP